MAAKWEVNAGTFMIGQRLRTRMQDVGIVRHPPTSSRTVPIVVDKMDNRGPRLGGVLVEKLEKGLRVKEMEKERKEEKGRKEMVKLDGANKAVEEEKIEMIRRKRKQRTVNKNNQQLEK